MRREKRSSQVKAHIPHSLRQQLELFVAEEGNVVSMSDYLHRIIEEHIEMRSVRSRRPFGSRRISNS